MSSQREISKLTTKTLAMSLILSFFSGCNRAPVAMKVGDTNPKSVVETVDTFTSITTKSAVDILIVQSNGSGMVLHQNKFSDNILAFVDELGPLDWQLGVTTSEIAKSNNGAKGNLVQSSKSGRKYISKQDRASLADSKEIIERPESRDCKNQGKNCPSKESKPLKATILAFIGAQKHNKGFFREEADLVLIEMTNQDERRRPDGVGFDDVAQPGDVVKNFNFHFPPEKSMIAHSITIPTNDQKCLNEELVQSANDAEPAPGVEALSTMTGGLKMNLCEPDYKSLLQAIAKHIRGSVNYVDLSLQPDNDKIELEFLPALSPNDDLKWRISNRRIYFNGPLPANTGVRVFYSGQLH